MAEKIKQKKIAQMVKEELSQIFQRESLSVYQGGMMTVSDVSMSPDLLIAKIYLSFYNIKDPKQRVQEMQDKESDFRGKLGSRIRNQVRRIPELHFYLDETLDQVFRMEEIFKQLKK